MNTIKLLMKSVGSLSLLLLASMASAENIEFHINNFEMRTGQGKKTTIFINNANFSAKELSKGESKTPGEQKFVQIQGLGKEYQPACFLIKPNTQRTTLFFEVSRKEVYSVAKTEYSSSSVVPMHDPLHGSGSKNYIFTLKPQSGGLLGLIKKSEGGSKLDAKTNVAQKDIELAACPK